MFSFAKIISCGTKIVISFNGAEPPELHLRQKLEMVNMKKIQLKLKPSFTQFVSDL